MHKDPRLQESLGTPLNEGEIVVMASEALLSGAETCQSMKHSAEYPPKTKFCAQSAACVCVQRAGVLRFGNHELMNDRIGESVGLCGR